MRRVNCRAFWFEGLNEELADKETSAKRRAEIALYDQAVDVASEIGILPGIAKSPHHDCGESTKKSVTLLTVRVEKPDGHYLYLPTPASPVLLEVMRNIEMRWRISVHQPSLRLEFVFHSGKDESARATLTYMDCDLPLLCLSKARGWEQGELRLVVSIRRPLLCKPTRGPPCKISM